MSSMLAFVVSGGLLSFLSPPAIPFYVLGVGSGILAGCFHRPRLIDRHSPEAVLHVLMLNAGLSEETEDLKERATLIYALLAPVSLGRDSAEEVGEDLENALDSCEAEDEASPDE